VNAVVQIDAFFVRSHDLSTPNHPGRVETDGLWIVGRIVFSCSRSEPSVIRCI
jgi:hypothetical protein